MGVNHPAADPTGRLYSPCVTVDQAMINEACDLLGVDEREQLKDGGQKTVRLVERGGDPYVLKVITVGGSSPQALQRAAREVDLLRTLDSPHVVKAVSVLQMLGGDKENGAAWLEEFLDGEDLADTLTGPWGWDRARDLGIQIARGLGAMHAQRVVHRDLSANNSRCTSNGIVKVMDPGVARYELLPPVTLGGHPGTPGFCSPEHLKPPPAGPTAFSDVFCLGILIWMALIGVSPIPYEGDLDDYLERLSRVQIRDEASVRSGIPPEQFAFLKTCLHPQPARRFRDGNAAAEELESV